MINISISLSNGDISLIIILCGGFIYFLNYLYLYFKKKYNRTMDTIYSINYTLQNLNYSLNDYIYASKENILKIRKNSEDVNSVIRLVSTVYTIKCYYDVVKPIINSNNILNMLSNCFNVIFDNKTSSCQYTGSADLSYQNDLKDNSCKYNETNPNMDNIKKEKIFDDVKCNNNNSDDDVKYENKNKSNNDDMNYEKKNKSNDDYVKYEKNKSNKISNIISKIINEDKSDNEKLDDIKQNIVSHFNNKFNSINAHPKLHLSNGLKINEKENIQNKFNEYIYNTDKLKNDILNDNINIFKKTDVNDTNKNNENINIKFNDADIVGINDGNMSYAPFN